MVITYGRIKKRWERLSRPLEILDAAFHRSLAELPRNRIVLIDFERSEPTSSSVEYRLSNPQFGELGTIELSRFGRKDTAIVIAEPPEPPPRQFTKKEGKTLDKIRSDPEEYKKKVAELSGKIRVEVRDAHRDAKRYHRTVIEALQNQLVLDPVLRGLLDSWRTGIGSSAWREPTRRRADLFKRVRDEEYPRNPRITQQEVAEKAETLGKREIRERLKEERPNSIEVALEFDTEQEFDRLYGKSYFSADDVKNVWRKMVEAGEVEPWREYKPSS